jgi:hypothetical protein
LELEENIMKDIRKNNNLEAERIPPWDVTPRELLWLDAALQVSFDKGSVRYVLELAGRGNAQIWRLSAPKVAGIAVTRIIEHTDFLECYAWLIAGQGLIPQLGNLGVLLRDFAKECGCAVVHTDVTPRLAKVYERSFGFRHDMTSMIMEV